MSFLKFLIGLLNHDTFHNVIAGQLPLLPEGEQSYSLQAVIKAIIDAHRTCPIPNCSWTVDRTQFACANTVGGISRTRFAKSYARNTTPTIDSALLRDHLDLEYILDLDDDSVHILCWCDGTVPQIKRKRVESSTEAENPAKRQAVLHLVLLDKRHQKSSHDQMYFVGPGNIDLTFMPITIQSALEQRGTLVPDCTDFLRAVVHNHGLRKFLVFTAPPQARVDLVYCASILEVMYDFHDPASIYSRTLGKMPADRLLAPSQRCANYVLYFKLESLHRCADTGDLSRALAAIIARDVEKFKVHYCDYLDFPTAKIDDENPVALIEQIFKAIETRNAQDARERPRSLVVIVIYYDDPFERAQQMSVVSSLPHPSVDDIRDVFSPVFRALLSSDSVERVLLFGHTPTFLGSMDIPHINISEDFMAKGVAGFTYGQLQHSIAAAKDIPFNDPSVGTTSNCIISRTPSYCLSPGSSRNYPRQYIFRILSVVREPKFGGTMVKMVTKTYVPNVDDLTLRTVRALVSRAQSVLGADFRVAGISKLPFSGDVWAESTLMADQDDPESSLYKLSTIPSKEAVYRILYKYGFLTQSGNKGSEEKDASQFDRVVVVSSWLDDHLKLNKDASNTGPLLRLPKIPFNNTAEWIAEHLTERILHKSRGFDANSSSDFNESNLQTLIAEVISYGIKHGAGGGVSESIFLEGKLKEDPNAMGGYKRPDVLIIAAVLSLIELKVIGLVRLYEGTFDRTITKKNGSFLEGQYSDLYRFYKYLIAIPKATWERPPSRRIPTLQERKLNNANMDYIEKHRDLRPEKLEDFYYRWYDEKGIPHDQSVIHVFHGAEEQVENYANLLAQGRVFDNRLQVVLTKDPVKMDIYTTVCLGGCCVVARKLESKTSKYSVKERK